MGALVAGKGDGFASGKRGFYPPSHRSRAGPCCQAIARELRCSRCRNGNALLACVHPGIQGATGRRPREPTRPEVPPGYPEARGHYWRKQRSGPLSRNGDPNEQASRNPMAHRRRLRRLGRDGVVAGVAMMSAAWRHADAAAASLSRHCRRRSKTGNARHAALRLRCDRGAPGAQRRTLRAGGSHTNVIDGQAKPS